MIKCPKCKSTRVCTEGYKKYRCQCGQRFTSLVMSQRISSNDGYDFFPETQINMSMFDGFTVDSNDSYTGGSSGGGGSSRSWEDSVNSYDSDSGFNGGDD